MIDFEARIAEILRKIEAWEAKVEQYTYQRQMALMRIRHKVALIIHTRVHDRTGINQRIAAKKFLSERDRDRHREFVVTGICPDAERDYLARNSHVNDDPAN